MLVAYLGLEDIDTQSFEKWEHQVGEAGEVFLKFF